MAQPIVLKVHYFGLSHKYHEAVVSCPANTVGFYNL